MASGTSTSDSHVEQWKPIAETDGLYEVSTLGNIRSFRRKGSSSRKVFSTSKPIKPCFNNKGYPYVSFNLLNGLVLKRLVSRVVLETFVGTPAEGMEAAHINGNPPDCRLGNLTWKTHHDNMQDCIAHGTKAVGDKNGRAKLSERQAMTIKALAKRGRFTHQRIGQRFGISKAYVWSVASGERWKHLPD